MSGDTDEADDAVLERQMQRWSVYQSYQAAQFRSDGFLYHYTDIGALKSILDDAQVWGTHVAYLNDTREFSYGVDSICELMEQYRQEHAKQYNKKHEATLEPLFDITLSAVRKAGAVLEEKLGPFVSCFSQSVDDLSQWRGYANGGYAIKFDPEILAATVKQVRKTSDDPLPQQCPKPELIQVEYIPERQYQRVKTLFNVHSARFYGAVQARPEDADSAIAKTRDDLITEIIPLAASLKHEKFVGEAEFRLVSHSSASFYSPSSSIGLIPRVRFEFAREAVKGIVVGPGQFTDVKKLSLDRYLARMYPDVVATTTEVPYREL